VDQPAAVQRALDVLELPAPADGAQAVVAFFNGDDRLSELLVLYRGRAIQTYPEPTHLAHYLVNCGFEGAPPLMAAGLARQKYPGGGLTYETAVFSRGDAVGAFFRVGDGKEYVPNLPPEARDFGAVHLDRTFEASRVQFAPDKPGPAVTLTGRAAVGRLKAPVADPAPATVTLQRENGYDLTASLRLAWPELKPDAELKTALALWAAYGPARIEGVLDLDGDYLSLVWEDAVTRLTLRLPYDAKGPDFTAGDRRGGEALAARARDAERADQDARKARLDGRPGAGKPLERLDRWLHLKAVQLGMTRAEVVGALPKKAGVRRLDDDKDGSKKDVSIVFTADPPGDAAFAARQMIFRFGPGDKLAEIRVRYQEWPGRADGAHPALLTALPGAAGAPQELPAPWDGLWPDLLLQEPKPALYRWFDDRTVLTVQRDGGGAEAVLRDWPADRTLAKADDQLPPLLFCDRGAGGVFLGDGRAAVLAKFAAAKPMDGGGFALAPAAGGPYDALAVWFDGDKVSRVVGRHAVKPGDAADAAAKLQDAWGRDFAKLGWPRRQDGAAAPVLQAVGWHDDRVRVRMLVQSDEDGLHLFTEWRAWPVAPKP
jgi:hypothetical protein